MVSPRSGPASVAPYARAKLQKKLQQAPISFVCSHFALGLRFHWFHMCFGARSALAPRFE